MGIMEDTLLVMQGLARESDIGLVGFSGGKDSLVVLDLACRVFKRVKAYHMYMIPGLDHIERQLDYARERFGVEIALYPHFALIDALRYGVYCDAEDDLSRFTIEDVYRLAMADAGGDFVMTGARRADSSWRRRSMGSYRGKRDHVVYPIQDWHKYDVLGYLKARNIPLPVNSGASATGVDLSTRSLIWLHDVYPDDFKKLLEFFPYAEASIWRDRFYGAAATGKKSAVHG
jgi:3'-phosphoadenosine 5'-phosphosulfate sulfotransferase (PAPS reductase)/FAD synthetase